PQGVQDFIMDDRGRFWIGHESKILKLDPSQDDDWVEMVDLTDLGIDNITRLAMRDSLILCVNKK
ncbi:MAG: hypothetical protein R3275_09290, partial [Saprospiraceae bacterium]|nr:hypothetical protein [Saprospiraceae bacterium]